VGTEVESLTPGRESRGRIDAATRGGAERQRRGRERRLEPSHSRAPHGGFRYLLPGTSLCFDG